MNSVRDSCGELTQERDSKSTQLYIGTVQEQADSWFLRSCVLILSSCVLKDPWLTN